MFYLALAAKWRCIAADIAMRKHGVAHAQTKCPSAPCFSLVNDAVLMLINRNLHLKRSEVSIKTRSTPASLSFKGQATKHTTVKWSIIRASFFNMQEDQSFSRLITRTSFPKSIILPYKSFFKIFSFKNI